ncbi:MAG: hypothetical protein U0935_09680 [Pirellulales bacterium]
MRFRRVDWKFGWRMRVATLGLGVLLASRVIVTGAAEWTLDQMIGRDGDGQPVYRARPIPARFLNPVDERFEREFQERARRIIAAQGALRVAAGNTYFENEKRTYGYLMAQVLAGRAGAVRDLQIEDAQAQEWHRETQGIDFYACFTLKHQTRKFFYFGDLLEPDYRQRMLQGARAWTARDPLRRPHYAFQRAGEGWGPNVKNSWVDVRSTENLYLMRVSAVYLFAEAAGNREVAEQYKREIRRYAVTLFRVGMGEWDSENYHGHSLAPLCNLYDFAQDDEVRGWAKACLDWVFTAGALKYYRGAFNGPTKRDYNHAQPFGGSAANQLWVMFGDSPRDNSQWESDEVHLITSAYRPPPAVIALARKQFVRPVEIWATKPKYEASTTGDTRSPPEYYETHYFGETFQLGSLASGTSEDGGDVNGCKLLVASPRAGAVALQGVPGSDPQFVGSPQYQRGKVAGPNRVAQEGRRLLWLVKASQAPWRWVVPAEARISQQQEVTFLQFDRTWVALRPLGASPFTVDEAATRAVAEGDKARFPGHVVLSARGRGESFCGVALDVGDTQTEPSFDHFRRTVLAAQVDLAQLDSGIVKYRTDDGRSLGLHWHDDPRELEVWRNGHLHDWQRHAEWLYGPAALPASPAPTAAPPVESRRGSGTLRVSVEGAEFRCHVAEDGRVEWSHTP